MRSTVVYRGCREALEGVDPSRIHRMRSTLVYRGCSESLEGIDPSRNYPHELYTSLAGLR